MGGRDKGLVAFRGQPLVAHAVRRLLPQVDAIAVSANRHLEVYRTVTALVITDVRSEACGPLAGIEAALTTTHHDWVATAPCDVPLAPTDWVEAAYRIASTSPSRAAYLRLQEGADVRDQPGFCVIHRTHAAHLTQYLNQGYRAWKRWLDAIDAQRVARTDPQSFINVNTLEDVADLEQSTVGVTPLSQ